MSTLNYFNGRGRAEHLRLILAEAGVSYNDHRFPSHSGEGPNPAFVEFKASGTSPFGQVPHFHDEQGHLAQSGAIARSIARRHNLYGATPREADLADQASFGVLDLQQAATKVMYAKPDDKAAAVEDFKKTTVPRWLGNFNKLLTSDYLAGPNITFADLELFDLLDTLNNRGPLLAKSEWETAYPALNAWYARVSARPKVAAYLASRPAFAGF